MKAPLAVSVAVCPAQIKVLLVDALIAGKGFTVTDEFAGDEEIHPAALVPITE